MQSGTTVLCPLFEKLLVSLTQQSTSNFFFWQGNIKLLALLVSRALNHSFLALVKIQGKFSHDKICPITAAHISFRIFFSRVKSLHLYRTINKIPSFLYISCTKICKNFPFTIIQVCQHDFCTISHEIRKISSYLPVCLSCTLYVSLASKNIVPLQTNLEPGISKEESPLLYIVCL